MNKIQTTRISGRFFCVLCVAALAAFTLFVDSERPEPEPEPPTPPVVDPDTLPTNKFIGTWVLCAMSNVHGEPPATCDLADATTDTLVFVDDTTLILHRSTTTNEYVYEFSDHYIVRYWPYPSDNARVTQYYFRENDQELILRGEFYPIISPKYYGFRRIQQK